jgi:hypothetical protein
VAKPGERKVNRTCTYVRTDGRFVPGIITALGAGSSVDLRVGHTVGDTHSAIDEMSDPSDNDVWLPGSRYRY